MMTFGDIADHLEGCDRQQECVIGAAVMKLYGNDADMANHLCRLINTGNPLGAARALLPPHTLWAVGSMEDGPFARLCWPQPDGGYSGGYIEASGQTVALALATAAMRGHASVDTDRPAETRSKAPGEASVARSCEAGDAI